MQLSRASERVIWATVAIGLFVTVLGLSRKDSSHFNIDRQTLDTYGQPKHLALLFEGQLGMTLVDFRCNGQGCTFERERPVPDVPEIWFAVRPREN